MSSSENGINSPLQMYKESTKKKSEQERRKLLVQFLFIFLLSHAARTVFQPSERISDTKEPKATKKDHTLVKIEVSSLVPEDQVHANLLNQKSNQEIEGVEIIERELLRDGMYLVKLSVPNQKSSWIINRSSHWKLIPPRKVISKRRDNYEITF